jgi:hypothetical protein
VEALTKKCSLLFNSARRNSDGTTVVGLKRESLEELYLYLKVEHVLSSQHRARGRVSVALTVSFLHIPLTVQEKVASGDDLGTIADEMHEIVYSQLSSDKGKEVVNMLLDMHILEDEQVMLRQRIQALLNPSPTGRAAEQFWGGEGGSGVGGEDYGYGEDVQAYDPEAINAGGASYGGADGGYGGGNGDGDGGADGKYDDDGYGGAGDKGGPGAFSPDAKGLGGRGGPAGAWGDGDDGSRH